MWSLPRAQHSPVPRLHGVQMRSRLLSGTQRPKVVPLHTYVLISSLSSNLLTEINMRAVQSRRQPHRTSPSASWIGPRFCCHGRRPSSSADATTPSIASSARCADRKLPSCRRARRSTKRKSPSRASHHSPPSASWSTPRMAHPRTTRDSLRTSASPPRRLVSCPDKALRHLPASGLSCRSCLAVCVALSPSDIELWLRIVVLDARHEPPGEMPGPLHDCVLGLEAEAGRLQLGGL